MVKKVKNYLTFLSFFAFGAFAFLNGASDILTSAKLALYGETAEGLVVYVERVRQGRNDIVVEFHDSRGEQQTTRSGRSYGLFSTPDTGESVEVKYLPDDLQVSMISSFWQLYMGPILVLSIGIIGLYAGLKGAFSQR